MFRKPKSLHDLLNIIRINELSLMTNICYYPNMLKYKKYFEQFIPYKEFSQYKFKMLQNQITVYILRAITEATTVKDMISSYQVLSLHVYGLLMRKNIKFCDTRKMLVAIGKLSGNHLFKKLGIEKSLLKLGERFAHKFGNNLNDEQLVQMYVRLRTLISQQVKALARRYHTLRPEDLQEKESLSDKIISSITSSYESDEDVLNNITNVYKIDRKRLEIFITTVVNDIVMFRHYLKLLIGNVDRKTQICSPIWRRSRILNSLNDKKLSDFLESKLKVHDKLYKLSLSAYFVNYIASKIC